MTRRRLAQWRERALGVPGRRRFRRPLGLALSGGGPLGAAHVGVLRALEEARLPVDRVAGTSVGAVAGALHAFGTPLGQIEQVALEMGWLRISSFAPSRMGLLANDRLGDILREHIGDPDFADARIPLAVVATDIARGEMVVLDRGPVVPAVLASACVPGLFQPVAHEGRLLVDGGLVENLPITPLQRMGARGIIGVDLNLRRRYEPPEDLVDVLLNSIDIAIGNATRLRSAAGLQLLIEPPLPSYRRHGRGDAARLVEEGLRTARAALADWKGSERPPPAARP